MMRRRFVDERGRAALLGAVRDVEAKSAAEVVVAVRERSGPYLHADLTAGIAGGLLVLFFQLFSPWEFSLVSIQLAPVLVGGLCGAATTVMPGLRRLLSPPHLRADAVRTGARATFQEAGVGLTRERTGVLVYVSLLERSAQVVADRAVHATVDAAAWKSAVAAIQAAADGRDPETVAAAIRGMGDVLAKALPRAPDDVNELADAVGAG